MEEKWIIIYLFPKKEIKKKKKRENKDKGLYKPIIFPNGYVSALPFKKRGRQLNRERRIDTLQMFVGIVWLVRWFVVLVVGWLVGWFVCLLVVVGMVITNQQSCVCAKIDDKMGRDEIL